MSEPLLSIVIPTREGFSDHWLKELLKVKGDIEFILVHPPGFRPVPLEDSRFKQLVCALRGEIIQRGTGFMNASGKYILTINCDEYLQPDIEVLVKDYFTRFSDSWVLRLTRKELPFGSRDALSSEWSDITDINTLEICGKNYNNTDLFGQGKYLLELPIVPLDKPFNIISFLGKRNDQSGNHIENFDKKVWRGDLVRRSIVEITNLMNLTGPIKYIPFWCLDRLLGLFIQSKFYEKDKIIGHWMPLDKEQIRVEDNPPEHKRSRRFYFIAEVLLLRKFPEYGYLWNLILAQAFEVPVRAIDSLKRKFINK